jgi:hypothetical protein
MLLSPSLLLQGFLMSLQQLLSSEPTLDPVLLVHIEDLPMLPLLLLICVLSTLALRLLLLLPVPLLLLLLLLSLQRLALLLPA